MPRSARSSTPWPAKGIALAGWDPPWFQALLGVLLLVALLANGIVRYRLKAVPRS